MGGTILRPFAYKETGGKTENRITMTSNLNFIMKLTDLLTPGMRAAATAADTAAGRIEGDLHRAEKGAMRLGDRVVQVRKRLEDVGKTHVGKPLEHEFEMAGRAAQKLDNKLEQMGGKGGGLLGNIVGGNIIADGLQRVASFAIDQVGDTYRKGLQMGSMRSAINATTGGQGDAAMAQTSAISNKYGLNYEASLEGVKTLTGGLKSMNMPLAEQMKIFEGVSTGMAAMKLDSEQAKGAMLALGQMASKGTVQAEELRGQLGERIPGAFGIAAQAMGVTEVQLNKMLQKGEVLSKDFLPAFAAQMQKTFGADALAAANGPAAIQARFDNAVFKMKASIGEGLMPLVTPVLQTMTRIAEMVLPYIQQGINWLIEGFAMINTGTGMWGEYMSIVTSYAGAALTTIKSLWGNIWSIVSAVGVWVGKSELLKDIFWVLSKLGEGLLWALGKVGDAISYIWTHHIQPILNGIEWAYSTIKGLFTGDKAEVSVVAKVKPAGPSGLPYIPPMGNVDPLSALPTGGAAPGVKPAMGENAKAKAEGINGGGQRVVQITIGKVIEKIEMTVLEGRGAAEDIAGMVRNEVRKLFYELEANPG